MFLRVNQSAVIKNTPTCGVRVSFLFLEIGDDLGVELLLLQPSLPDLIRSLTAVFEIFSLCCSLVSLLTLPSFCLSVFFLSLLVFVCFSLSLCAVFIFFPSSALVFFLHVSHPSRLLVLSYI